MAVKKVLMLGNPLLREKSEEVKDFQAELKDILPDLKDTLTFLQKTKKLGRALAAPQIGYQKRVICYQLKEKSFFMVNPLIIWKSNEIYEEWDSCFSFDTSFFLYIARPKKIKVIYQDEKGNKKTEEFEDSMSALVQHEIDHLNGILATDHLKDNKNIIMREEWERRYR